MDQELQNPFISARRLDAYHRGAIAPLASSLAEPETSPAAAAHAVGDLIVYNYRLYKVTSPILVGDTLTVGANIAMTTAAEVIGEGGGGGGGGSAITVVAADSELYGGSVTITDGASTATGTLSSSGVATIHTTMTGTLQVTVENGSYIGEATLSAPYYGNYSVAVEKQVTYTLNISTSETTLYGQTVTVTDGTHVKTGTLSALGAATIYITFTGELTVSATDGDQTANETVEVSSGTLSYSVSLSFAHIYGVSWDGTSTTSWSRTDEAASFTDPVPAVGNGNGSSPFDNKMPWSGMVKVEDATAGTLVKIPKFYYKLTQNGNGMKIQIADAAVNGYSVSPAHMDRGDGAGERNEIYVGAYHCDANYKSTTGVKPKASITRSTARTGIHNLGASYWQMDFATWFTIWLLYLVEYANWNSQAKIGYGCGNNSGTENSGLCNSMTYHTGTNATNRTAYGHTRYRYIEDLWGNVYDWLDGCYYNSNGMYAILKPSSFSDSSGGSLIGKPSNGYPSKFTVSNVGGFTVFYASETSGGGDSAFSCDRWFFSASVPCLCVGGCYGQDQDCGLFRVGCVSASHANASIGCRLLKLP